MPAEASPPPKYHELALVGLPRSRLDEASARLFAEGTLGLQEDWLPGTAPPVRQPWDADPPKSARGEPNAPDPHTPDRIVLRAWFDDPDRASIEAVVADLGAEVVWGALDDRDWEAERRARFAPVHIGPDLIVAPPWDAPPGALIIDPGQGFGTGHHPSTVQALRALSAWAPGHRTALDVGTGSGVLAIAAARRGIEVEGIDVEEAAVRDAEKNAALNGVTAQFSTTPIEQLSGARDLVLANLHAELLVDLAAALDRLTGRTLIVAGILADRERAVVDALGGRFALRDRSQAPDPQADSDAPAWICLVYGRDRPPR